MEHEWWRLPGQRTAHAFAAGPGWMRSACGDVRWTTRLVRATGAGQCCRECAAAVSAGTTPEPALTEAEAAVAWGR